MVWNWILCSSSNRNPRLVVLFSCFFLQTHSFYEPGSYTTYTISSITYPTTTIRPYEWKYIRVELPQWFSKVTIGLQTNVDINTRTVESIPRSELPVVCFRDGGLPLPDNFNTTYGGLVYVSASNGSVGRIQKLKGMDMEQCYPMREFLLLQLTNEQISPGVWYIGLFNGIGPTRTQGKMIVRSSPYSFITRISVEGCRKPMMWGKDCNRSVNVLPCDQSNSYKIAKNGSAATVSCESETSCGEVNEPRVFSSVVVGMTEQLVIETLNVTFNGKPSNGSSDEIQLLCYARHGGVPSSFLHDYSANITKNPLVIHSPKIGNWYFSVLPVNLSKAFERTRDEVKVCYSMGLQMHECPLGKTGPNCIWERYTLQTYLRKESVPFESYYLPISEKISTEGTYFPLGPLLSNPSIVDELGSSWTYFQLDVPRGAAGGNIHIQLTADAKINFEIYVRFGGLPTLQNWDYYYANATRNSQGSAFFLLYHSSEDRIDFYILYAREGPWSFGVRHLNSGSTTSHEEPTVSFSLERCPKRCSSYGTCMSAFDASGLTPYSYCSCDRNHGGFDCSQEIVSHEGHIWQSVFLIGSNAAALLPAFWALKQKAFAEWVLFTSSGIASAIYHACDVGTWCVLTFNILQFMDFWLSFMAVISTFVYLATNNEATKRAIHTAVAILTALIAITNATRSSNVVLVIAIGTMGLLIGWLVELSSKYRSNPPLRTSTNTHNRWQITQVWFSSIFKKLLRQFHWGFVVAGFVALVLAGTSWIVETTETYWIWHSIWHITIYTSSFLFLCSKPVHDETHGPAPRTYELTRQNSFSLPE